MDIEPFEIAVPDEVLEDLRDRLRRTRWPEAETVDDWSQGIPLSYVREVCDYWANGYDWRARERALNRFDQFVARVGDMDVHFIHARSRETGAVPLLITHGWPGSVVEFLKVIEAAHRPGDPRRGGIGRLPRGVPVAARLRLQRQAHPDRLGRGPNRRLLGRVDGRAGLRPASVPRAATGARGSASPSAPGIPTAASAST